MNEEKAIELLKKYEDRTISADEKALLETWYLQQAKNSTDQLSPEQLDESVEFLKGQLPVKLGKERSIWPRIAAAASILFILSIGGYFVFHKQPVQQIAQDQPNIAPGKNAATLTLANGQKILLANSNNGLLAKQAGVTISKTADGQVVYQITATTDTALQYNTISTANGEQYKVILPDGSAITLNAASSIKYPASFARLKERKIELTGEAYFAVVHNTKQPFKVLTRGQQVEDIGTEFNINSYTDEPGIKTTLIAGAAKVIAGQNQSVTLKPNEQALLKADKLKVSRVDAGVYTAWKDGRFAYQGTALQEVMRQVARWYNVQIAYNSEDLKLKRLSGGVSRYDKVSGILNAIGYTAKVKFKIADRTITVLDGE